MSTNGEDEHQQPLALDDILHRLTPSPGPPSDGEANTRTHAAPTVSAQIFTAADAHNTFDLAAARDSAVTPSPTAGPSIQALVSHPQSDHHSATNNSSGHRLDFSNPEPDTLTEQDVQAMRDRLSGFGYGTETPPHEAASRESELAFMVLRLLSHYHYIEERDISSQLASQAQTIASLTVQRNLLIQRYDEACASWQSERDGWERSAEALLAQKSAVVSSSREEIVNHAISRLEDENKRLTEKITEQRQRLKSLESDLMRLRPLLLIPQVLPEYVVQPKPLSRLSPSPKSVPASEPGPVTVPPVDAESSTATAVEANLTSDTVVLNESSSGKHTPGLEDHPTDTETQEEQGWAASQKTLAGTQSMSDSTKAQATIIPDPSFQALSGSPTGPPFRSSGPSQSYYRTSREREEDLAIPSPRKTRSVTAAIAGRSTPQTHDPRAQAREAASTRRAEPSGKKQVMNPLWLATSPSRTKAEKRAASMLSDAKAELMLAAARKIGKRRVAMAAGFTPVRAADVETKREARDGAEYPGKGKDKGKERADRVEKIPVSPGKHKGRIESDEPADASSAPASARKSPQKKTLKKSNTVPASTSTPSTAGTSYYTSLPSMPHVVYLNPVHAGQGIGPIPMQVGTGPNGVPVYIPMGGWPPMAPSAGSTSIVNVAKEKNGKSYQDASPSQLGSPPKPTVRRPESQGQSQGLSSLLDAARMLEDDEGSEGSGAVTPTRTSGTGARTSRRTKPRDDGNTDQSTTRPTAKRRKVAPEIPASPHANLGSTTTARSPGLEESIPTVLAKASSALDVLADQAAQEHERRPPTVRSTRRRTADTDTQPLRASTRRRQSGGRSRAAANHGSSSGVARGKQRPSVQEEPERHSSSEVSLSRKRRRGSPDVGLNSDRMRREPSLPPTELEPSPTPEPAVAQVAQASAYGALPSSVPPDPHPPSAQQMELQSTQSTVSEPGIAPPATPSSDVDAVGSPDSTTDPVM